MIFLNNSSIKTMDPNILLSLINTKLRDEYSSLDLLVDDLQLDKNILVSRLKEIDYYYDETKNSFK